MAMATIALASRGDCGIPGREAGSRGVPPLGADVVLCKVLLFLGMYWIYVVECSSVQQLSQILN